MEVNGLANIKAVVDLVKSGDCNLDSGLKQIDEQVDTLLEYLKEIHNVLESHNATSEIPFWHEIKAKINQKKAKVSES